MAKPTVSERRRRYKILRLFFGLVLDFARQYVRARLTGRTYDFFEDSARNRRRAIKIRRAALEMGGVLIKVGQFLSSRVDLLPSEYIEELALLQDEVPPVPFPAIRAVLTQELGVVDDMFASIDSVPLAAASLGQVHLATLRDGATVALKVQRPNIEAIVAADLRSLRYVVRWLDRHTVLGRRADLPQIMQEFEDTLFLELDYLREGHHAERLAVNFRDNPYILIPRIYWSHTSLRVLTMQYLPGIKVTDFAELERQEINRSMVAEILMRAYLQQVLHDGFFHADPHPGNVFVRPGPVVVLLDFGMVGEITPQTRDNIRRVFIGIIRRDYDGVIHALKRLGFFTVEADALTIKRAMVWAIQNFYDLSFGDLRSVDPRTVVNQLQDVLFAESFHVPAHFAFLGRALGTLTGLCTALDPSFQFVTVAEPYARELIQGEHSLRGRLAFLSREARSLAGSAYRLPFLFEDVLDDFRTGEGQLRRELIGVQASVMHLERGMRRVMGVLLAAALIITATLLFRSHDSALAIAALAGAAILVLRVSVPAFRRL